MTKSPIDDSIIMFIGNKAFTLKELGPIADMRLDEGLKAIVDGGLLGDEFVGCDWYDVIKSSGFSLESDQSPDDELLYSLFEKYNVAREQCRELSRNDQLTEEAKEEMMKLRRSWLAAKKLSTL